MSPTGVVVEEKTDTATGGLRARSLRGAVALSVRQVLGMVLSLGGVLVLTHILGPGGYGIYAVSLGVAIWLQTLADWGVGVYLVRIDGSVPVRLVEAQGFTLLMAMGATGSLAGIGLLVGLGQLLWSGQIIVTSVALVASTPVALAAQVPMARLDRAMDYRRVAAVELSSQISLYATAIPLTVIGLGPWGPTVGLVLSRVVLLLGAAYAARWTPRLHWDSALARDVLGYGFGYSASVTIWQLRALAVPMIVAPFAGEVAAGQVALTIRLVEIAGFIKSATWRLGLAALVRVQDDRARLARAVRDGAALQTAALGVALGGIALVLGPLVGPVFGPQWGPVAQLFPFVAFGAVCSGAFSLHSSALYAGRHNWSVTWFHVGHVALFLGCGALSVHAWGLQGYGYAELVALPAYAVLFSAFSRRVGPLHLDVIVPLLLAIASVLAVQVVGPMALLGISVVLWPESRKVTRELTVSTRTAITGRLGWRTRSAF